MGSITDSIAYDYKERNRALHGFNPLNPPPANSSLTLEQFAIAAMQGLLSAGSSVSYDTAHQAFKMAQMMVHVQKENEYGDDET